MSANEMLVMPRDAVRMVDYLSTEEALQMADHLIGQRQASKAVEMITDALLILLRELPKDLTLRLSNGERLTVHNMGWPRLGVELDDNNGEISARYLKNEFTAAEGFTYHQFLSALSSRINHALREISRQEIEKRQRGVALLAARLFRIWTALKVYSAFCLYRLHGSITTSIQGLPPNMDMRRKRRYVQLLVHVNYACLRYISPEKTGTPVEHIGRYFHEPMRLARAIDKRAHAHLILRYSNDSHPRRSGKFRATLRNSFAWEGEASYRAHLAEHGGSKILASMHFGYPNAALFRVLLNNRAGSTVIAYTQNDMPYAARRAAQAVFKEKGIDYRVIPQYRISVLDTVATLRKGNTTLSLFFDLPGSFGGTAKVRFLNNPAWFSKGPAELALVSRVPIYPVFNFSIGHENFLEVHDPILPRLNRGETLAEATARITQLLVRLGEQYIRRYPEQWQYIGDFTGYFSSVHAESTIAK